GPRRTRGSLDGLLLMGPYNYISTFCSSAKGLSRTLCQSFGLSSPPDSLPSRAGSRSSRPARLSSRLVSVSFPPDSLPSRPGSRSSRTNSLPARLAGLSSRRVGVSSRLPSVSSRPVRVSSRLASLSSRVVGLAARGDSVSATAISRLAQFSVRHFGLSTRRGGSSASPVSLQLHRSVLLARGTSLSAGSGSHLFAGCAKAPSASTVSLSAAALSPRSAGASAGTMERWQVWRSYGADSTGEDAVPCGASADFFCEECGWVCALCTRNCADSQHVLTEIGSGLEHRAEQGISAECDIGGAPA